MLFKGFDGRSFADIATSLTTRDPYMVLADFEDYCRAQQASAEAYRDKTRWNRMALLNTAGQRRVRRRPLHSGLFGPYLALPAGAGDVRM